MSVQMENKTAAVHVTNSIYASLIFNIHTIAGVLKSKIHIYTHTRHTQSVSARVNVFVFSHFIWFCHNIFILIIICLVPLSISLVCFMSHPCQRANNHTLSPYHTHTRAHSLALASHWAPPNFPFFIIFPNYMP